MEEVTVKMGYPMVPWGTIQAEASDKALWLSNIILVLYGRALTRVKDRAEECTISTIVDITDKLQVVRDFPRNDRSTIPAERAIFGGRLDPESCLTSKRVSRKFDATISDCSVKSMLGGKGICLMEARD